MQQSAFLEHGIPQFGHVVSRPGVDWLDCLDMLQVTYYDGEVLLLWPVALKRLQNQSSRDVSLKRSST